MTNFLYAVPSFLGGAARVLDLGSTFTIYNETFSPSRADSYALKADWVAVGDDMKTALEQFAEEHSSPQGK
jgi:hypothetical protein